MSDVSSTDYPTDPTNDVPLAGGPVCPQDASTDTYCMFDDTVPDPANDSLQIITAHHMHCNTDGFEWVLSEPPPAV